MAQREWPRCSSSVERGGIIFRLMGLVVLVLILASLYFARHPLLRMAGDFWVVDESPAPADAIVVLGDDNYDGDRATRAAELFKAGWAPRVVASGRYLRPYATIAELEEHDLTDRGVPKTAVVRLEHHAADTREEAAAIGQLMAARGWKRLIVVTSNYHTRRSRYIFDRVLPPGMTLHMTSARDSEYDPDTWWRSRQGLKIFAHEFAGMGVALWELRDNRVGTTGGSFSLLGRVTVPDSALNGLSGLVPVYTVIRLGYSFRTW